MKPNPKTTQGSVGRLFMVYCSGVGSERRIHLNRPRLRPTKAQISEQMDLFRDPATGTPSSLRPSFTLTILRHELAENNTDRRRIADDAMLTRLGRKNAARRAKLFRSVLQSGQHGGYDGYFVSPLDRAQETVQGMIRAQTEHTGEQPDIYITYGLRERAQCRRSTVTDPRHPRLEKEFKCGVLCGNVDLRGTDTFAAGTESKTVLLQRARDVMQTIMDVAQEYSHRSGEVASTVNSAPSELSFIAVTHNRLADALGGVLSGKSMALANGESRTFRIPATYTAGSGTAEVVHDKSWDLRAEPLGSTGNESSC